MKALHASAKVRTARLALVAIALLLAPLLHAHTALASESRFTYELCDPALPGGGPPQYSWHVSSATVAFGPLQLCGEPSGWVGIDQWGQVSENYSSVKAAVPETPGGYIESETITAFAQGMQPGSFGHVLERGWPPSGVGDTARYFLINATQPTPGVMQAGGSFDIELGCSTTCAAGTQIGASYVAATEVDPNPPVLAATGGSLLASGPRHGHQELTAEATDVGGGVARLEVMVDGAEAASPVSTRCAAIKVTNPSYTGIAAFSPSPCPAAAKASWNLDTSAYPFVEGTDSVQVCANDFATSGEPNRTCSAPRPVIVDNSCAESAVAGGATLVARFTHSRSDKVTVHYGAGAKVSGRLTGQSGHAISGATICVRLTARGSSRSPASAAIATTGADGRFVYTVPPGPDREVVIGYRHDSLELTQPLSYRAHVRPLLRASPRALRNGETVHLSGSLPGPRAAGRVVVLQAAVPGTHRWITFLKATTGRHGRYRADYHFTSTTRKIRYGFRALVPRQAGYPWDQGASKPIDVTVTR